MRCKKHLADLTSTLGVCASCLRERLAALIEAQIQAQAQAQLSRLHSRTTAAAPLDEPNRKSDPNPPPLIFPRSVSPYVSRRKSDDSTWHHHHHRPDHNQQHHHHHHHQQQHRIRFYSTPQVGPTYTNANSNIEGSCKKSKTRFSLLSSLFRSRSDKSWSDPRDSSLPARSSSASSPSWFSSIFARKTRNRSKHLYIDESSGCPRPRGLSPDLTPDPFEDCDRSRSGSGDSSATTPEWRKTPTLAPSSTRRARAGQGKNNVSGLAFCLSPLVRASPNRHWNQKGLPPEIAGEIRVAASFCKNRSRKLADFGRANPNR